MKTQKRYLLRYVDEYCDLLRDDNIEIVRALLHYKLVSPFFYDIDDEYITPIATASYYGSANCLKLLCEHGATKHMSYNKTKPFLDPLLAAIMGNKIKSVQILLAAGVGSNALWDGLYISLPDIMTCFA